MTAQSADPLAPLSGRQREVVLLAAAGLSNAEIAQRLELSESTVKVHVKAAFGILGVNRRSQLVALVGAVTKTPDGGALPARRLPAHLLPVAEQIALGATDDEIAAALGKSKGAARSLVRDLKDRLGAANRVEVANWWLATHGPGRDTAPDTLFELARPGGPDAQGIARRLGIPTRELADRLLVMVRGAQGAPKGARPA